MEIQLKEALARTRLDPKNRRRDRRFSGHRAR